MSPSILSVAICLSNVSSAWSGSRSATGPAGAAAPSSRTFGADDAALQAIGRPPFRFSRLPTRKRELQFHQGIETGRRKTRLVADQVDEGLGPAERFAEKGRGARIVRRVRIRVRRDDEAFAGKLVDKPPVGGLHVACRLGQKHGAPVRRNDRGRIRRGRGGGASLDAADALLQVRGESIHLPVEAVVALAAVEEGGHRFDVVLNVARVEQESVLPLQFRRARFPLHVALADQQRASGRVGHARGLAQGENEFEFLVAVGTLDPVRRHDDDQELGVLQTVVDDVVELVALADAPPVAPDVRLLHAQVPELQTQLLVEEGDKARLVRVRRQNQIVVVRVRYENDDVVARHRSRPSRSRRCGA